MISSRFLDALESRAPVGSSASSRCLPRHHGPGAGRPLLLPPGHLIGKLGQDVADAQLLGHIRHLPLDRAGVGVVQGQGKPDVLLNGQGIQQVKILEHKAQPLPAEPGQLAFAEGCDALPVQQDVPGAHGVDGGDAVEQGGFAAARRAHDGDEFSGVHVKAHPVQGAGDVVFAAVIFFDVFDMLNTAASFAVGPMIRPMRGRLY